MTRETKIGLIIAGSFLCLVGIVVASKWRGDDASSSDTEESSIIVAANPQTDESKANDPPPNGDKLLPKNQFTSSDSVPKDETKKPMKMFDSGGSPPLKVKWTEDPKKAEAQKKILDDLRKAANFPGTFTQDAGTRVIGAALLDPPPPAVQIPSPTQVSPKSDLNLPNFPAAPNGSDNPPFPPRALKKDGVGDPLPLPPGPPALDPAPFFPKGKENNPLPPLGNVNSSVPQASDPNFFSATLPGADAAKPLPKQGDMPPLPQQSDSFPPLAPSVVMPPSGTPAVPNPGFPPQPSLKDPAPGFPMPMQPAPMQSPSFDLKDPPMFNSMPAIPPMPNNPQNSQSSQNTPLDFQAPPPSNPLQPYPMPNPRQDPIQPYPMPNPRQDPFQQPYSVPVIGTDKAPVMPPITVAPYSGGNTTVTVPPAVNVAPGRQFGVVQVTAPDSERVQLGETNFGMLSKRFYGTERYGDSLLAFNRRHSSELPDASDFHLNPPLLRPGQTVFKPPVNVLERDFRKYLDSSEPPQNAPVVSSVPPVKLSAPTGLNAGITPIIPAQYPPGPPTADRTRAYVVQNPRGENILDIAERLMGDRSRWHEIYRINPNYRPENIVPAGTELRLPVN